MSELRFFDLRGGNGNQALAARKKRLHLRNHRRCLRVAKMTEVGNRFSAPLAATAQRSRSFDAHTCDSAKADFLKRAINSLTSSQLLCRWPVAERSMDPILFISFSIGSKLGPAGWPKLRTPSADGTALARCSAGFRSRMH